MKIHEYQAKEILARYDVPIPKGRPAWTLDEVRTAAADLGGRVVVKAQVHAGGRGKGGGVKVVDGVDDAVARASDMFEKPLVTPQTTAEGVRVRAVLVEEAMAISKELYLGIVLDRQRGMPVLMASAAGGMEIEEVAATTPEKIVKAWVDPATGFRPFHGRKLAYGIGLSGDQAKAAVKLVGNLYRVFTDLDCSLAEINPLVVTGAGSVLALDAKLNFDDNALFRHPEIKELRDTGEEAPLEVEASRYGINYIKLDGSVGCMVNGAGLAMATMDLIKYYGGEPANFLDVGGGANADQVTNAFRIILSDPNVRAVLINIFGGITRCDVVANGIVEAAKRVDLRAPMVVRLVGTNVEEGRAILANSGLRLELASGLAEAAQKVVAVGVAK
ncbi:MAG: ADP-forming succinate--CoA ligase subunit beta [Chloroflexota bacterium]|nr:MAG: ADP-forming succinate--CoA ligase subunit beta [Chloroflexota bacterium]